MFCSYDCEVWIDVDLRQYNPTFYGVCVEKFAVWLVIGTFCSLKCGNGADAIYNTGFAQSLKAFESLGKMG